MKKRILSLCISLALCLGLLPVTALAAGPNTVYVGGVELTGSAGSPVYAKTDTSGTVVTNGASESNYNVKWDGSTLTLRNATIEKAGIAPGMPDIYAAIYRPGTFSSGTGITGGDLTIQLEGSNTVIGQPFTNDDAVSCGIFTVGSLTIGGNGSVAVTGGEATATGNDFPSADSRAISTRGNLTVTGGATVTANGGKAGGGEYNDSYGIYVDGSTINITGGATVTAVGGPLNSGDSYGICMKGGNPNITITDSAVEATGGNTNDGSSYGIDGPVTVSGNSRVSAVAGAASGYSRGISGPVTVSGGELTATGKTGGYGSYGIEGSTVSVSGGTVTATGGNSGVFAYNTVSVGNGLAVYVGENENSTSALTFQPNDNIKDEVKDKHYFRCEKAKLSVTLTANAFSKTYDGQPITLTATPKDGSGNITYQWYKDEQAVAGVSGSTLDVKNVADSGVYKVKITDEQGNIANSESVTITITKATPIVAVEDQTVAYDGKTQLMNIENPYTITLENGEAYDIRHVRREFFRDEACNEKVGSDDIPDAGDYYVRMTYLGSDNYNAASDTGKLTVSPAALTVTANGYEGVYDGQPHSVTVTADEGAAVTYSTNGTEYSATNPTFTEVGTYTVYYKVTKDNYQDVIGTLTVKITPAITTTSLPNGTVGEPYTATLQAAGNNITWSVTNGSLPAGLTLESSTGVISGTPTTVGSSTFTVKAENSTGSASQEYTLTIKAVPVTGVALDQTELDLFTGESKTLTATVQPDNATNKNVTWSSDKPEVATVEGGTVKAVAAGEATITVTTVDGSKTATCTVTVTQSTYIISADTTALDFGSVYTGYTQPAAQTVTITNTGNQPLTLTQPTSTNSFEVGNLSKTELPAGEKATFTVQPKAELAVDTYSENITVSGTGGATVSIPVTFTVKRVPPTYGVTVLPSDNGTVTCYARGAEQGATVTVNVKPDGGYHLDKLVVTDAKGNVIDVKQESYGTYTFVMPATKVTIEGVFVKNTPEVLPFTDVKPTDWFYNAVKYVYDKGLMDGVEGGQFAPNATLNRAMLVTILYRLDGQPAVSGDMPFTDVPAGTWYTNAVKWASDNGIVNGVEGNQFAPNGDLTREQMAAVLYRYAQYKKWDVSASADLTTFVDGDKTSSWAADAMQWAVGAELVNGLEGNTLAPQGTSTRAQVATVLMRFCENIVK